VLTQWRYKICKKFADCNGQINGSRVVSKFEHTKPIPNRVFLYKPTGKKYDYVDYTGRVKGERIDISDKTFMLEVLGYIKYVSRKKCDGSVFR
jgi:hypothetical protein